MGKDIVTAIMAIIAILIISFGQLVKFLSTEYKLKKTDGKRTRLGWIVYALRVLGIVLLITAAIINRWTDIAPLFFHAKPIVKKGLIKVAILPFKQSGDQKREYAEKLAERLSYVSIQDSMDLEVNYLKEFGTDYTIDERLKDSILKHQDADLLVWGSYASEGDKNLLALQYSYGKNRIYSNENPAFDSVNFEAFSAGKSRGDIEYLSYYLLGRINYWRGFQSNNLKNIQNAIRLLQIYEGKKFTPPYDDSFTILGLCYFRLDSVKKSIAYYRKQLQLKDSMPLFLFDVTCTNLSTALVTDGQYTEADSILNVALSINPQSIMALYMKSSVARSQYRYHDAIFYFKRCIQLDSNFVDAYQYWGYTYREMFSQDSVKKYLDSAIMTFSKGLLLKPKDTSLLSLRAETYWMVNDFKNAASDYTRAIAQSPKLEYIIQRAICYLTLKKHEDAIADLHIILNIDSKNEIANQMIGVCYAIEKKYYEAVPHLRLAIELKPNDLRSIRYLIQSFYSLGDPVNCKLYIDKFRSFEGSKEVANDYKENIGTVNALEKMLKKTSH